MSRERTRPVLSILDPENGENLPYAQFLMGEGDYWEVLVGHETSFVTGWQSTGHGERLGVPEYQTVDELTD